MIYFLSALLIISVFFPSGITASGAARNGLR
jgi:hypothetical protein